MAHQTHHSLIGRIVRWGSITTLVAGGAVGTYMLVAETPFTENISLVSKSYAAAKIDTAIGWGHRALTTDPAELMDDVRSMGEKVEKVLREYRGPIATGEFDGVLESIRGMLEDQRTTISNYRTSQANQIAAERELTQCIIQVDALSQLAHAVDKARDTVPGCTQALQNYQNVQKAAAPAGESKKLGKPTAQQLAAESKRIQQQAAGLERLASCAETMVTAYGAFDAAQQKLEQAQQGKNAHQPKDMYEAACLMKGLAVYAPVMERRELNGLLDTLTGQMRGFYDGESRYARDRDAAYHALSTMNVDDVSQARKSIDARVEGSVRIRFFVEDVQALSRMPKQYRVEAARFLAESVYASSPEEGEQLARMLAPKMSSAVVREMAAALPAEEQRRLYGELGAQLTPPSTNTAPFQQPLQQPMGSAPGSAHYDAEDRPAQTYTPPIPEKGFLQRVIEKIL
ncbi:MAG: hypothetical protein Q7R76_00720 [Candidatus Woesearchaeota archaeon]|nr:hypothetical protein [Candidatus Woesearchaeota archaeon]